MRMGDYLFNVLSAVIAIDYMDHGFQKKYHGKLRVVSFLTGCGSAMAWRRWKERNGIFCSMVFYGW